jgi:glutamine cyclotransferase
VAGLGSAIAATLSGAPASASDSKPVPERRVSAAGPARTPVVGFRTLQSYPHDAGAFTQGLIFENGVFYESTGLVGESSLRRVDPPTGKVLQTTPVDGYFTEGLALLPGGDELAQLTWQTRIGFVYDRTTLRRKRTFSYATEGWGLACDGARLAMSDGSATIRWLDPTTLKEKSSMRVTADGRAVAQLNELEFVRGELWANVWQTDFIAAIDPKTGVVRRWIDLRSLLPGAARGPQADVLNGIAWDRKGDRVFVTGKKWPLLFEIAVEA